MIEIVLLDELDFADHIAVGAGERVTVDQGPDHDENAIAVLVVNFIMGIPFTHVDTSDSVEGWKARDIPSLGTSGRWG